MIILASASPRRKELMSLITPNFIVRTSDVDESNIKASSPKQLAKKLAKAKCLAMSVDNCADIVIGCDTVVEIDDIVLGKPKDKDDAMTMLMMLSGRCHKVHTGVCIAKNGLCINFVATTNVVFTDIPYIEAEKYVNTDEPYDKAGAYGIQGWAAKYVKKIDGCYYNVMGLPVSEISSLLSQLNVKL